MHISYIVKAHDEWSNTFLVREEVQQMEEFTEHQIFIQRVLAISSSTTSIVFCLVALYTFFAIDPRRLVFRHHLIFFLLIFDLLKAIILLIFPSRVFTNASAYFNTKFCQVIGFFTATAMEGADFAILSFAIHTFLLIFKTSFTVRLENGRTEGGLYIYRYYVYVLSLLIPLVLASLAFIGEGYKPYVCWCYLPQEPVWYRLVLSWVPRWIIIVLICSIYLTIYVHVIREFNALGGMFKTMNRRKNGGDDKKPTFFSALKYAFRSFIDTIFPKIDLLTDQSVNIPMSPKDTNNSKNHKRREDVEADFTVMNPNLYGENLENFRKRQKIIQKQMKSIFIYPFAYILIWLFPFILYCTQINYEKHNGPVYWLNCVGAFMQPSNGFIDSLVFFYREIPWEYTVMKNFAKDNADKYASMVVIGNESDSVATSAKLAKHSFSVSMAQNTKLYSWWRQVLHYLKLPLFKLPSQENVCKASDLFEQQLQHNLNPFGNQNSIGKTYAGPHDFSNLLSGDLSEKEFRVPEQSPLNHKYQLNNPIFKRHSASQKSWQSRQPSAIDPVTNLPNNFNESQPNYHNDNNNDNNNNNNHNTHNNYNNHNIYNNHHHHHHHQNDNDNTNYNNNNNSSKIEDYKLNRIRVNSITNTKTTNKKVSSGETSILSSTSTHSNSLTESEEMDFIEFLKQGP